MLGLLLKIGYVVEKRDRDSLGVLLIVVLVLAGWNILLAVCLEVSATVQALRRARYCARFLKQLRQDDPKEHTQFYVRTMINCATSNLFVSSGYPKSC